MRDYYQKLAHPMKYVYLARITGTGPFPIDMLRRDQCHPFSENDSAIILETLTGRRSKEGDTRRRQRWCVQVRKHSDSASQITVWTPGRWKSFGCTFEEVG